MAPNDDDPDERNDLLTVLLPADGKKRGGDRELSQNRRRKGVRTKWMSNSRPPRRVGGAWLGNGIEGDALSVQAMRFWLAREMDG